METAQMVKLRLVTLTTCLWSIVSLLSESLQVTTDCLLRPSDLLVCAGQFGISRLPDSSAGFGFGFGSVMDVELMCRTKWHLKVYACARKTVTARCSQDTSSRFRTRMWQFIFDTTRYTRAANYLCRAHNLGIFRKSKRVCLLRYEKSVQACSERYSEALSTTILRLAVNSTLNATDELSYADHMISELTKTYCVQLNEKMHCVSEQMKEPCTQDTISLIRNYYKESLSNECVRLLESEPASQVIETKSTKYIRANATDDSSSHPSQQYAVKERPQQEIQSKNRNTNSVRRIALPRFPNGSMLPFAITIWIAFY